MTNTKEYECRSDPIAINYHIDSYNQLDIYQVNQYIQTINKGGITMQTKPFINMFGSEVQLTREQFIDRWMDKTEGFMILFMEHGNTEQLVEFKNEVNRMAGLQWDKSK